MRALVTIEFDDNWGSNFTHAAGALEARGLKGVFNCISGRVEDWEPSGLGVLTYNALVAAGELLIPVETSYLPLEGVASLLDSVKRLAKLLRFKEPKVRVLACRHKSGPLDDEVTALLRARQGKRNPR